MKYIRLDYGADDPLLLEVDDDALSADCRGPEGVAGEAARQLVTAAALPRQRRARRLNHTWCLVTG